MKTVRQTVENAAVGVAVCDELEQVSALQKPGVAAAIWRRNMPADFQTWIDGLPVKKLPSARIRTRVDTVREATMAICNSVHVPFSTNRRLLVNDVGTLAEQFANLMGVEAVQLRFDVVQDDACRKFHIDAVTARLVCTYRGPGTQYGISTDGNEPKRVFSVPTGSPMLLRGTKWPGSPQSGLLHRSPPIEGTDVTRFMLVIDPHTTD